MNKRLLYGLITIAYISLLVQSCNGFESLSRLKPECLGTPNFEPSNTGLIYSDKVIIGVNKNTVREVSGKTYSWTYAVEQTSYLIEDGAYENPGAYEFARAVETRELASVQSNGEYPVSPTIPVQSLLICIDSQNNIHWEYDTPHRRKKYSHNKESQP